MRSRGAAVLALTAAAIVGCGAAGSSCVDDYLVRRDSLAMGEGDSVRADMARQMIDPWPAASNITGVDSNGERLQHAMEQYRNPSANVPGANANVPASTVPVLK